MKICLIAGARPNFMKISPIIKAIIDANENGAKIEFRLVHTGQHYDDKLSKSFFDDLNIPKPDVNLEVGSGTHAQQTSGIMVKFEEELSNNPADYVLVVGDVNSTIACALVAKKLQTKVIHVEAGLRSYDLDMPEEINRMATDALTDLFFTTTPEAGYNLVAKGVAPEDIHFVGNTMIDSLITNRNRFRTPPIYEQLKLKDGAFYVMTLHRPSNVDSPEKLRLLLNTILDKTVGHPIIFPVHPRTKHTLDKLGAIGDHLHLVDPLGYLEFMYLVERAKAVITDSGGIQEETTYLDVPCFTLRENTERPETITKGTNELVGSDINLIKQAFEKLTSGQWKKGRVPELWDGKAAQRLVKSLQDLQSTQ